MIGTASSVINANRRYMPMVTIPPTITCIDNCTVTVWGAGWLEPASWLHLDDDTELDSPNCHQDAINELASRDFVRINDPRKK